MISDRGRGEMWVNEAGKMVRGIRGMNASIKAGEEKRRELIKVPFQFFFLSKTLFIWHCLILKFRIKTYFLSYYVMPHRYSFYNCTVAIIFSLNVEAILIN